MLFDFEDDEDRETEDARNAFFTALRQLHEAAGRPSTRTIARKTSALSHTTVAELLRGRLVPSWPKVRSVARYLGVNDYGERKLLELWNAAVDVAFTQPREPNVEDQPSETWSGVAPAFQHAPDVKEPPVGTVIAYQTTGWGDVILDYVTFRAGNGRWYTTGRHVAQGTTWEDVRRALRAANGPARYATAWAELTLGATSGGGVA